MTHLEAIRFLFLDAGQAGFQRPKTLAIAFRDGHLFRQHARAER